MQAWLRDKALSYQEPEKVYRDLVDALAKFDALRPKHDLYTYDDGRTQLLLSLHGLLPITFKGSVYNIPIALWITRDYPRSPPISYVVPTPLLLIRPSSHVDLSGRCSIDYLLDWIRKPEPCNLTALLLAMQHHFSRFPPLYAKSSPRPAPQQSHPPIPSARTHEHPPALPPKPISSRAPVLPPRPIDSNTNLYDRPPPPLPHRQRPDTEPPQYPQSTLSPQDTDGNALRSYTESLSHTTTNYRTPIPLPYTQSPLALVPPPTPPSVSAQSPQHIPPPAIQNSPPQNLLDDESPAPQPPPAPAPPRPPNPELLQLHAQVHEKIRSEFASLSQLVLMESDRLRAQQSDLLAGEPAIRDEMARLEAVRDVCQNVAARVRTAIEQADRNLQELRRKGDPEVDELVCSTSIVHNQLINLVAEDNAIEDTIYHLHRALNAGRIDLERFLRTTRVLAEEQFMKRALIEKIQAGMPLGTSLPYS